MENKKEFICYQNLPFKTLGEDESRLAGKTEMVKGQWSPSSSPPLNLYQHRIWSPKPPFSIQIQLTILEDQKEERKQAEQQPSVIPRQYNPRYVHISLINLPQSIVSIIQLVPEANTVETVCEDKTNQANFIHIFDIHSCPIQTNTITSSLICCIQKFTKKSFNDES